MTTATSKATTANSTLEFIHLIENGPVPILGAQPGVQDEIISIAPESWERVVRCFWKDNLYVRSS